MLSIDQLVAFTLLNDYNEKTVPKITIISKQ